MADSEREVTSAREPSEPNVGQPGVAAGRADAEVDRPVADEQIRLRAYELYLERGGGVGDEREDWFRAEREHRERSGARPDSGAAP